MDWVDLAQLMGYCKHDNEYFGSIKCVVIIEELRKP